MAYSSQPNANANFNFYEYFKKRLKTIDESTRVGRTDLGIFFTKINTLFTECRRDAHWNEAMITSAFCQYLEKKSNKSHSSTLPKSLGSLLPSIHPGFQVTGEEDDLSDTNGRYSLTFLKICQHRVGKLGQQGHFTTLKEVLSNADKFYDPIFKESRSQALAAFHCTRLLAELAIIRIPGEAPWPSIDNFNSNILPLFCKNERNKTYLLTFFESELRYLMLDYYGNPKQNPTFQYVLQPRALLAETTQRLFVLNTLAPVAAVQSPTPLPQSMQPAVLDEDPYSDDDSDTPIAAAAAAAGAPTPPPQSTKPPLLPVPAPRHFVPRPPAPPVAAKSAAAVQAARLLANQRPTDL